MRLLREGASIEYAVGGSGPAVLFLHAFPLGQVMWDAQADFLEPRFRVIRFDDRGFGGSSVGDGPLTMDQIADDAVAVLDHLGVASATVVGCSMGGYAAFAMLRRHARRVRALVLANTRAGADTDEARGNRATLAQMVLEQGSAAAADAFLPKLLGATTHRERAGLVERLHAVILANPPRGVANALLGLGARADSRPTLAEVTVPTLVISGTEDTLTPPPEAEALERGIRGSRLERIERAGHLANLENPEAFNAALGAFLDGLHSPHSNAR